jgi:hypothetical protein
MPDYIKKKDESPVEKKTTPSWKEKEKKVVFQPKKWKKKETDLRNNFCRLQTTIFRRT